MPSIRSTAFAVADTSGPVTCSRPAATAPADVLVAVITSSQTTGGSTTGFAAPGWDPAAFWNNGADPQIPASAVLWRPATDTDPPGWSFTRHGTSTQDQFLVHVLAVADTDRDIPFVAAPGKTDQASNQRNPVPAPSVQVPDDLTGAALLVTAHIAMSWYGAPGGNRWSVPAGMAKATDQGHSWAQMCTNTADVGPGPTGSRSAALSQTPNQQGRGIAFGLRPPPPPGAGAPEPGRLLLTD